MKKSLTCQCLSIILKIVFSNYYKVQFESHNFLFFGMCKKDRSCMYKWIFHYTDSN